MSGWRAGDMAVCIKIGDWLDARGNKRMPRTGEFLTVQDVTVGPDRLIYLRFREYPGSGRYVDWFYEKFFIKVTPDADLVAEEREAGVLV